ncbi:E3 ubiquitin-protein ligase TRIM21-like [Genypterus blacodes]|uniref:E3 ubiquitin-protein ligase TRIM21-like n=1 Tax=Genypterus blacodes TaxID=154954 RepID=UPI003F76B01B
MSHPKRTCHLSEAQFLCSICLDIFTDPVSIPCGHNFCNACITQHWDMNVRCVCPLCQRPHVPRPALYVNTVFSEFTAEFRQSAKSEASRRPNAEPEEVQGDYQPHAENRSCEILESRPQAPGPQSLQLIHPVDHLEVRRMQRRNPPRGFCVIVQNCVCCPDSQSHRENSGMGEIVDDAPTQLLHRSQARELYAQRRAELRMIQRYYVDITLNPASAHPSLLLDCDTVANGNRLDKGVYVLGMQKFTRGRIYYEVQVKGETPWAIGLAIETIWSRGYFTLCPQNGYWTVWFSDHVIYALTGPPVRLNVPVPVKVGVYLNYEEGVISFYNTHTAAVIFSYTGCHFTHRLLPFFCPMMNGGRDTIPVI